MITPPLTHHFAAAYHAARDCGAGRLHAVWIALATVALVVFDRWSLH